MRQFVHVETARYMLHKAPALLPSQGVSNRRSSDTVAPREIIGPQDRGPRCLFPQCFCPIQSYSFSSQPFREHASHSRPQNFEVVLLQFGIDLFRQHRFQFRPTQFSIHFVDAPLDLLTVHLPPHQGIL